MKLIAKKFSILFLLIFSFGSIARSQINKYRNINEPISIDDTSSQLNPINEGTLSFFVYDAENGYGIQTEIVFRTEKEFIRLQTNENGHLQFKGNEGKYNVTISSAGHQSLSTYFTVKKAQSLNINVIMDRLNKTRVEYKKQDASIVEGYVVDFETGKPLANVEVGMPTEKLFSKTNQDGFFSINPTQFSAITKRSDKQIRSDFSFGLVGYTTETIENLLLVPDKIKFKIALKKGGGNTIEKYIQHVLDGTSHDVEMYEKSIPKSNSTKMEIEVEHTATGCVIPSTIRVGTSCSCTSCSSVEVMSLQYYSESGIDNEWISSWQFESLAAGSVAYRSYGGWYVNNPVDANFDIASTTCNQVWGSAIYSNTQSAAQATTGQIVTDNGIDPARSEYSAENNQGGTSYNCSDCNAGGSGAYSCYSDNQCCGQTPAGHGRGMCQWGTQYWAQNGQNNQWIIDHYYIATVGYSICGGAIITPSNLSVTNLSCPQIGVALNWTDSGSGWYMDVSTDPNFGTYYNKDISNLTSITCPGGFCDYPNCTSYLQFKPGITYYWRIFNGSTETNGSSFTTPVCTTLDVNCSGSIDDSGGSGANYADNEDYTYTISPVNTSSVTINFSSFDLETNFDSLYIYDGSSTASPLIGGYTGLSSPGIVSSTGGSITIHFISDPFVNNAGFSATWNCTPLSTGIESVADLSSINIYPNPANGEAYLHYVLSNSGFVTVRLFDVLGREIILLSNTFQSLGEHTLHIDLRSLHLAQGIYDARILFAGSETTIKLIVTPY